MKKVVRSGLATVGMLLAASVAVTSAAQAQIKIAVAGPITGPNAAFGAQLRQGAEMAAADINARGGINGQKIEIVIGDDVSKPEQGVSVANKLVGDGVKFVIGHFNSGVTLPASNVYAENGMLMITPAATNPQITERNLWNVFRTCGRDDQQGEVAAKYIVEKFAGKKVAIIHDKTTYGKGLADETKKAINKLGITEAFYEGVNAGEKDFSALVSKIKGVDLVYWGGLHTEAGLIVRQMRDQGMKAPLMGGDGMDSSEFASIAGPGAEGVLMTNFPDPRRAPEAAEVVKKFTAKNFDPEAYTLYSYAAMQLIEQAAAATKSLDPKAIATELRSGKPFKTVIGDRAYDKKGDVTRADYVMYTWSKVGDKVKAVQNN